MLEVFLKPLTKALAKAKANHTFLLLSNKKDLDSLHQDDQDERAGYLAWQLWLSLF